LPCLWLGAQFGGIQGLFYGALIGNILAGLSAWFTYSYSVNQLEKSLVQ
jgi:hypothetical protein